MATRNEKLQRASFRGVPFGIYYDELHVNEGRVIKKVKYSFADTQLGQDMGYQYPDYEMTAVVHGPDFLDLAEQLKAALNKPGKGTLVLPHVGSKAVLAMQYNVNYSTRSIGKVVFELRFMISNADVAPDEKSIEDIYQSGDVARIAVQEEAISSFNFPRTLLNSTLAVTDAVNSVTNVLDTYSSYVNLANGTVQEIARTINSGAVKLVRDPQQLFEKLIYGNQQLANGLMASFSSLFSNTNSGVSAALSLFNSTDLIAENGATLGVLGKGYWPVTTNERIERNENRSIIDESIKISALTIAFELGANFTYNTNKEIINAIDELNQIYDLLFSTDNNNATLTANQNVKDSIDQLRTDAFDLMNQKLQQVYVLSERNFPGTYSVMNFTNRLYQEEFSSIDECEDLSLTIAKLNDNIPPDQLTGNVEIFEVSS